jgi:hypothetical protein
MLVWWELRHPDPMVDLRLMRNLLSLAPGGLGLVGAVRARIHAATRNEVFSRMFI